MKKPLVSMFAVLALVLAAAPVRAQESKPLVALSLPSYDEVLKDIAYVGGLAGQQMVDQQVRQMVAIFAGGLDGLDKTKPSGFVLNSDGVGGFSGLGFVPVTDLGKLLNSLQGVIDDSEAAGDGVTKLTVNDRPVFVKASGGWAYLAQDADTLGKLPDSPLKWLGGMDKKYDIAARVYVQNIPQFLRGLAVNLMRQGLQAGLQQREDESPEDFAERKLAAEKQFDQVVKLINDIDQVTLAYTIDSAGKKLLVDVGMTAVAGSDTAKQLAANADVRSNFGGFYQDDAVVGFNGVSKLDETAIDQSRATLAGFRTQAMKGIDRSEEFADEDRKKRVKEIVGELLDVLEATVKGGRIDFGLAVAGKGPFTVGLGIHVADGQAAEKALKKALRLGQAEGNIGKVQYNVANNGGVAYHRVPLVLPPVEEVTKVVGEDTNLYLGVGKDAVYLGFGPDAVKQLQAAIAKSSDEAAKAVNPGRLSVALGPILKFASGLNPDDDRLKSVADALAGGSDHIRITNRVVPNGEFTRVEMEEGLLKAIGALVNAIRGGRDAARPAF